MNTLNLLSVTQFTNDMVNTLSTSLGVWYLIIVNSFGVISIILKVTEFQCKTRKCIFLFATLSSLCWTFYFTLQGDFISALVNFICVVQMLVFFNREKHKWADSIWWMIGFLSVQLFFSVLTFKTWIDIFALVAGAFAPVAYYVVNKSIYRKLAFFSLPFWILNGIFKGYFIALINDSFAFISVFISIIRFDIIGKRKARKIEQIKEQE